LKIKKNKGKDSPLLRDQRGLIKERLERGGFMAKNEAEGKKKHTSSG